MFTANKIYGKYRNGNYFFLDLKKMKLAKIRAANPSNKTSIWCGLILIFFSAVGFSNVIFQIICKFYNHYIYIAWFEKENQHGFRLQ